jgi:precorrin-6B methylase 2
MLRKLIENFEKLLKADKERISRIHCVNGRPIDCIEVFNAPKSFVTWLWVRWFDKYSVKPWWVWESIRFVSKQLNKNDIILEDGSGMSTLWLASRCANITSLETSKSWALRIQEYAASTQLNNIRIVESASNAVLGEFTKQLANINPTTVVIDGVTRRVDLLLATLREGANVRLIIYDNVDRAEDQDAYKLIEKSSNWQTHVFRGFAPGLLHANETAVFIKQV